VVLVEDLYLSVKKESRLMVRTSFSVVIPWLSGGHWPGPCGRCQVQEAGRSLLFIPNFQFKEKVCFLFV